MQFILLIDFIRWHILDAHHSFEEAVLPVGCKDTCALFLTPILWSLNTCRVFVKEAEELKLDMLKANIDSEDVHRDRDLAEDLSSSPNAKPLHCSWKGMWKSSRYKEECTVRRGHEGSLSHRRFLLGYWSHHSLFSENVLLFNSKEISHSKRK